MHSVVLGHFDSLALLDRNHFTLHTHEHESCLRGHLDYWHGQKGKARKGLYELKSLEDAQRIDETRPAVTCDISAAVAAYVASAAAASAGVSIILGPADTVGDVLQQQVRIVALDSGKGIETNKPQGEIDAVFNLCNSRHTR